MAWRGAGSLPGQGLLKQWPKEDRSGSGSSNTGLGYGGYSVSGNRLFTVGLRGEEEYLIAVDTTSGKELWSANIGRSIPTAGAMVRMTPTVDGDRVYAIGGADSGLRRNRRWPDQCEVSCGRPWGPFRTGVTPNPR